MPRLPALFALLAVACASGGDPDWHDAWGDPWSEYNDEDGVYQGPTRIHRVFVDCELEESYWAYGVETIGWTAGVTVTAHLWYPGHEESYGLNEVTRGEDRQWELLERWVPIVAPDSHVPEETTTFPCSFELMTWMVSAQDTEGQESDCVVFGYDPSVFALEGCRPIPVQGG